MTNFIRTKKNITIPLIKRIYKPLIHSKHKGLIEMDSSVYSEYFP